MISGDCEVFAGVDLGGTKIAAVVAGKDGVILSEGVIPTQSEEGPEQAVRRTCKLLNDLCQPLKQKHSAIGIGLPGLIDSDSGKILFLPNLPVSWRDFPISAAFVEQGGRPVFLMNDARIAALGEFTYGSRRAEEDLLFVTVGTGIGGGLVLDGKLRLGAFGAAGEIGHHTILPDGPPCSCGANGCLETLVSGPALARGGSALMVQGLAPRLNELTQGDPARVTATLMASAALSGDKAVAAAIDSEGKYLGVGIANAVTITAVRHVVIGGGLSSLGEMLLEPARRETLRRVRMFPAESVTIRISELGEKCGALGGVALAAQQFHTNANSEFARTGQALA